MTKKEEKNAEQGKEPKVVQDENTNPKPQEPQEPQAKPKATQIELENTLHNLADLAHEYRLPTWQSAALNKMLGWAEGKKLTKIEYEAGLKKLAIRRIGGN